MNTRQSAVTRLILIATVVSFTSLLHAERQNDVIGFSSNHVFESVLGGENIDVLSGNLTLAIPLGPHFTLSDTLGYQVTLYYNSKIWEHDCRNLAPGADCLGTIVAPGSSHPFGNTAPGAYGVGFNIGFGRIYRDARDESNVYKYQEPNGADHYFLCSGNCTTTTADGSGIRIVRSGTNAWSVYPGDGTKLSLTEYNSTNALGRFGWYTTEIASRETVGGSAAYRVEIVYNSDASIDVIRDYTLGVLGRDINFTYESGTVRIAFPKFGVGTADYVLYLGSLSARDPITTPTRYVSITTLAQIAYPGISERYTFDYGATDTTMDFGYLKSRTLPTGAQVTYHYRHYGTSTKLPLHSEIAARTLNTAGQSYQWTYSRFSEGPTNGIDEYLDAQDGLSFRGTNPHTVRVLDPFQNLSVYHFYSHVLSDQYDCSSGICQVWWSDGLLYAQESYLGPDLTRLVERQEYRYVYGPSPTLDGDDDPAAWFQYRPRPQGSPHHAYSIPVAVRVDRVVHTKATNTPAGLDSVATAVKEDWAGLPLEPQTVKEYKGAALYRKTYSKAKVTIDPVSNLPISDFWLHGKTDYTEVRDAIGQLVSRTDRFYQDNRVQCEVQRKTPATATVLTSCSLGTLPAGDIAVVQTYNDFQGGLISTQTRGGDNASFQTVAYHFDHGVLASKQYPGFSWYATSRTVDPDTGLISSSLSPGGVVTSYHWDALGRLIQIVPSGAERPTTISYPNLRQTILRQEISSTDGIESIYNYDDLGRLTNVRRRNLGDDYDIQYTEYDIAGRVTRKSEWAPAASAPSELKWTTYDYTAAVGPGIDANGQPLHYPDPLGRVHVVTDPLGTTIETSYDSNRTTTTVHDIAGQGGTLLNASTVYDKDELGRLIHVDSPDGADATYAYDERDNLKRVELVDSAHPETPQIRRFEYDSLSRLSSAVNPESGTVQYLAYDARGNLLQYRDAKLQTFTNAYDLADRLLTKSINLGGADFALVENTYDLGVGAAGRLTKQKGYRALGSYSLVSTQDYFYRGPGAPTSCALGLRGYSGLNGRLWKQVTTLAPWNVALTTEYCQDELGLPYLTAYPDTSGSGRTRTKAASSYRNGYLYEMHDLGRNIEYINDVLYGAGGVVRRIVRGNLATNETDFDDMNRPARIRVFLPQTPYEYTRSLLRTPLSWTPSWGD